MLCRGCMRLLIIGNLGGQFAAASEIASNRGAKINHCDSIGGALSSLREGNGADLVMMDVKEDVAYLIESLLEERFFIPVVGCGVDDSPQDVVKAIKAGAKEYIPLPPDEELIAAVLEAIVEKTEVMIAEAPAMKQSMAMAKQVAPSNANVLITGESGTGKEVVASYIHQESRNADKDFISVNCAAIPDNLLESELFGHEKGAFTGAIARRIGKFEEANNSTLLLDEISEMDLRLQAKLLRAIQEQEIVRVGGNKPVKLNLRIVATSNRDLQEAIKEGRFREDLFFRLNVIHIQLPPLRERKEDIPAFADYFIKKYSIANGITEKPLSDEAVRLLDGYHWPGNVRELENTIHRSVLLSTGDVIGEEAIILERSGDEVSEDSDGALVGRTVESVEKELILNTLDQCLGNRTHAANILGISIRTLRNKLKAYEQALGS